MFVDASGSEYPALVEYAPSQRLPKRQARPLAGGGFVLLGSGSSGKEFVDAPPKAKSDLSGTYESDPMYQAFLEKLTADPTPSVLPTPEEILAEIEAKEKELRGTVSQAYFALHKTLHKVQNFHEKIFIGTKDTSGIFKHFPKFEGHTSSGRHSNETLNLLTKL